ncbi:MAG: hypothetical protein JWM87_2938, partial [Candidatus Eremiobacteraeota bacterium]|nr:hypothetical protein [Candidatus Eremiobacteraeota bacterium]
MPSGALDTTAKALDFTPTEATLERVIAFLAENGDGTVPDAALRREALAQ